MAEPDITGIELVGPMPVEVGTAVIVWFTLAESVPASLVAVYVTESPVLLLSTPQVELAIDHSQLSQPVAERVTDSPFCSSEYPGEIFMLVSTDDSSSQPWQSRSKTDGTIA